MVQLLLGFDLKEVVADFSALYSSHYEVVVKVAVHAVDFLALQDLERSERRSLKLHIVAR